MLYTFSLEVVISFFALVGLLVALDLDEWGMAKSQKAVLQPRGAIFRKHSQYTTNIDANFSIAMLTEQAQHDTCLMVYHIVHNSILLYFTS
jgi:hypothetical protein